MFKNSKMSFTCRCEESVNKDITRTAAPEEPDELEDPVCQPNNPRITTYEEIKTAKKVLDEGGLVKTNLIRSKLSDLIGINIYLKCDFLQHTGSYKERGARYAIMCLPENKKSHGVVAASSGNHALALCHHARDLRIPATVVMPVSAPIMKVQNCISLGAKVITEGATIFESKKIAMKLAQEMDSTYINGYDHPDILAGAGTLGIEVLEQLPTANAIVVPVGGGGLIAGLAVAVKTLKPCTKIIGVESENCASFNKSLKAGKPVFTEILNTIADGLAVPLPGYNAVATAKPLVDRMITVSEDDISVAILRLIENEKFVVEGAGATALAAALSGQLNDFKGKNVVLLLTGGNIDTTVLGRALQRGLASDGRLLKFYITIVDRPGSVAELSKLISSIGVSIKTVHLERTWVLTDVFSMTIKVVCETKDYEHGLALEELLKKHYAEVRLVHAEFPASTQAKNVQM